MDLPERRRDVCTVAMATEPWPFRLTWHLPSSPICNSIPFQFLFNMKFQIQYNILKYFKIFSAPCFFFFFL